MSDQKAQIIGELQRKGKRITGQRKILLDVILEGNGPAVRKSTTWPPKRIQLSAWRLFTEW